MNTRISRALLVTAALAVSVAGCGTTSKNLAAAPRPAPIAAAPAAPPAPPPAAVVMAPPAPPAFVIEGVSFDFDRSTPKPRATGTLDLLAAALPRQSDVAYGISGFTDSVGSDAYNQGLSERRAVSVREYLITRGVSAAQIAARGYGESSPVASNATDASRAKNRRVEIRPLN